MANEEANFMAGERYVGGNPVNVIGDGAADAGGYTDPLKYLNAHKLGAE